MSTPQEVNISVQCSVAEVSAATGVRFQKLHNTQLLLLSFGPHSKDKTYHFLSWQFTFRIINSNLHVIMLIPFRNLGCKICIYNKIVFININ